MSREAGFYWTKREIAWHGPPQVKETVWEIAKYEYGGWYLADGSVCHYSETSFLEIDERRISREPKIFHDPNPIQIERTCRDDWPGTKTIDLGGGNL